MARQGVLPGLSSLFLNETQQNQGVAWSVFIDQTTAPGIAPAPGSGGLQFVGFAPNPIWDSLVPVAGGSLLLSGFAPSADSNAIPSVGAIQLSGFAPHVTYALTVPVAAGSGLLSGFAPTVTWSVSIPAGQLIFGGDAPAFINLSINSVLVSTVSAS